MSDKHTNESFEKRIDFSKGYLEGLKRCLDEISFDQIADVIGHLEEAYQQGKQVFFIGNGGSAATASHMACDLGKNILPDIGKEETRRFRVIALSDNVPWITALANDLGYEHIFSEQLRNLVQEGDLVIAISGSGNSPNIVEAVRVARVIGAQTVGILGFDGGELLKMVDSYILVESTEYGYIEDVHMVMDHVITSYFSNLVTTEIGR